MTWICPDCGAESFTEEGILNHPCEPKHVATFQRRFTQENGGWFEEVELPSDRQVGGDHYKDMVIEPSEFIYKNKLNWLVGNAIKYLCRYDKKHGENDLDKAIHYIELLKQWEYR